MIKQFDIRRDSNQPVENNFKITKKLFFLTKKHIKATRFIQQIESLLEGRVREKEFPRITERQRLNQEKKIKLNETVVSMNDTLTQEKSDFSDTMNSSVVEGIKGNKKVLQKDLKIF